MCDLLVILLLLQAINQVNIQTKGLKNNTFFAATAAICNTFLTSGFPFLVLPNAELNSFEAWPKKPPWDWEEDGDAIEAWRQLPCKIQLIIPMG